MRVDTILKLRNTFDLFLPVATQDPITGELNVEYVYSRSGEGLLMPGANGGMYLMTREAIPVKSAIQNIKDAKGTNVFEVDGVSYAMYVFESGSQFDPFGTVIGWKHILRRTLPVDQDARFNNLANKVISSLGD